MGAPYGPKVTLIEYAVFERSDNSSDKSNTNSDINETTDSTESEDELHTTL